MVKYVHKITAFLFFVLPMVLAAQNSPPVAVFDSVIVIFPFGANDSTYFINLLQNDYDPDGDSIEIAEIIKQGGGEVMVFNDSCMIKDYSIIPSDLTEQLHRYRVREKNDTTVLSNWAWVNYNPAFDSSYPVARNDTFTIIPNHEYFLNVLRNDVHPLGDSIFLINSYGGDSTISEMIGFDVGGGWNSGTAYNNGYFSSNYYIRDSTSPYIWRDIGKVVLNLTHYEFFDSLTINNINARFNNFGLHFQRFSSNWDTHFKVPNGKETSTIFLSSLWMAGLDENDDLHVAADRYLNGRDFLHGPVSEAYDSLYDIRWFYMWKLNREELNYHREHWNDPGYEPFHDILTWPGNGRIEYGETEKIAPFEDNNGNGIYEPMFGDVPVIKGDQALFFVFNDNRIEHSESHGVPFGIEVHGMAYAFDAPEDSALWNTIFLHYDILNRTDTFYHDVYLGIFNHFLLGYDYDNYLETDVANGMIICYNGDEEDQTYYDKFGYGFHPPAQGVQFLAGPLLPPDGLDNPRYDIAGNLLCSESFNGLNFGDGIKDNERMGLSFVSNFFYGDDPSYDVLFYRRLQGIWNDQTEILYGGLGFYSQWITGPFGPVCRYTFPGDSDPVNWGTYGLWPNGGYNQNGFYWTERELDNFPNERRALGSCGPFDLPAHGKVQFDLAFPWARDYDGTAWESAVLLKERAAYIKELFQTDSALIYEIEQPRMISEDLSIQPNPATGRIRITNLPENNMVHFYVVNGFGEVKMKGEKYVLSGSLNIDLSSLPPGHYILQLRTKEQVFTNFVIKI